MFKFEYINIFINILGKTAPTCPLFDSCRQKTGIWLFAPYNDCVNQKLKSIGF